jgi:hypothetical protein
MGYIGRDNRLTTFTKQSITANGILTDFTLEQGVGDSSSILVSVGGIVQQPDVAYSATGKTLSFTSAPGIGTTVWVVYLGKELHSTYNISVSANADSQIGVGNGTTTPFTLSHSVTNPQSIIVTLNGVAQEPTTDFTVSGTTLTFTTAPDATSDIMVYFLELETAADYIHDGSITTASFAASDTMPAWNGSALTNLTAGNLTGALPALDGSALTDIPYPIIKSSVDPTVNENPGNGLGTLFLNHTTGNMWALTNATTDQNVWTNVGSGTGHVENTNPTEANNPGPFTWNESTSEQVTFAGATDPDSGGSVTHYKVDNITPNTYLSVSVEEVAAGQPHTFVVSDVPSNQNVTFRVRAKDNDGGYSSGITVSATLLDMVYTVATSTNSTNANGVTVGDYKVHTFVGNGTFTVSQIGTDANIDYLVVAGGGAGGNSIGGGGGAGGLRNSFNNETSGGGGSSETAITGTAQTYQILVGAGGVRGSANATSSKITPTSGSIITTVGGGNGGDYDNNPGTSGGSGGGGNGSGAGGNGEPNQGYRGGLAPLGGAERASGGGGAGAVGAQNQGNTSPGGVGGAGVQSNIDGNNHYWAGGGGGGAYNYGAGNGGIGGGGGGSLRINAQGGTHGTGGGSARNSGDDGQTNPSMNGGAGGTNTGAGGGGGTHGDPIGIGGQGGSGVVIVRYKFQN